MMRSLRSSLTTKPITSQRTEPTRTIYAIKEGWITKKGSKSYHSFRRRYIILWSSKRIDYYTDDTLSLLKGSVNLHDLHRRFIQRSDKIPKKDKSMHGFKIITNKRTWYFCVKDANLRDEWIQTIRDTIDEKNVRTNTVSTHSTPTNTPSLLKSKIDKIRSQNKHQWNQLMAEQRIKGMNAVTINRMEKVQLTNTKPDPNDKNSTNMTSNDRYNSDEAQGENMSNHHKQHTLTPSNTDEKGFGEFNLKQELMYEDSEGSVLGLSLSTTPILTAPHSNDFEAQMENINISQCELNDFWNLNGHKYIELSDNVLNGVYCTKHKCTQWISCFGTKIVENGANKIWRIKITSRMEHMMHAQIANIVIGISDVDIIKNGCKYGPFWKDPYFGYGFAGYSGKKVSGKSKSIVYADKYRVGDVVTVCLEDNALIFMCNHNNNGVAFKVDHERRYVLAVALCNNLYDLQICEE